MTPQQYLDTYAGQSLLYNQADPSLRGQCVQAVCFYVARNGHPVMWADAYVWWSSGQFPDDYERIPNTADAVPEPGDIIIWGPTLPGSAGAGHIAVCLQPLPGTGTFISIDQNWGGKTVHKVTHTYAYVVGWLRFKTAPAPAPAAPAAAEGDEMITTTDEATKLYKMLRPNSSGTRQDELNATVGKRSFTQWLNDAQSEVDARDANLRSLETQLVTDSNDIGQLTQTIQQLQSQLKASQDQVSTLTARIQNAQNVVTQAAQNDQQTSAPSDSQTSTQPAKSNPLFTFIASLLRIKKS